MKRLQDFIIENIVTTLKPKIKETIIIIKLTGKIEKTASFNFVIIPFFIAFTIVIITYLPLKKAVNPLFYLILQLFLIFCYYDNI